MLPTPDSEFSVVLDACVLAPMPLCDTLLRCAEEHGLYRVLWSRETLDEVRRTLMKFGCSEERAARRVETMQRVFPYAVVEAGKESPEALRGLPDSNDWHVIAAAMDGEADAIVTLNLRHFPLRVLGPLGIDVYSPDEFLVLLWRRNSARVMDVLGAQAGDIGMQRSALLDRMMPGLPNFVKLVQQIES